MEQFDVLVVGAGLSGVGAAVRLAAMCPEKTYVILEGRAAMGGTWDIFHFPGVRSDSDMFTLSYPFRPWTRAEAIADGPSILQYIRDTAEEFDVERHIRYRQQVTTASWSSADDSWTVEARRGDTDQQARYSCRFLYLCSGYYRYDGGYLPNFPGADNFRGHLVHPQQWPDHLDYRDRRVVIIGSGATAVTLAPAMADQASHVTVLQRSPSYLVSLPTVDPVMRTLRHALPGSAAHRVTRWKNILLATAMYQLCRRRPLTARRLLRSGVGRQLPIGYHLDPDFLPRYEPWDQRLCVVPDGDLFTAIRSGRVSMVTDRIDTFTPTGIRLESGDHLDADVVVSATGLRLVAFGGIELAVDGRRVDPGQAYVYRGCMLGEIPNLAMCLGYTNASWTLRADLTSRTVCRLLNKMDRHGFTRVVPRLPEAARQPHPLLDLSSGYVTRSADDLPKQGSRPPWRLRQNYILDLLTARLAKADRHLTFSRLSRFEASAG